MFIVVFQKKNIPKAEYKIKVYSARCLFWDEKNDVWSNQGCVALSDSSPSELVCRYVTADSTFCLPGPLRGFMDPELE